ncbi:MAG: helix-turn-helix domain-containing protein [Crocinitomicaceae bacterium]|nr:helix-turn-helix domain-containing protein [Crocinitomicaceae bacterium]
MTNLTLEKLPQAVSQLFDRLDTIENLILNKNNQTDSDQLLTIQQASELTKLSVPTLYGYVSRQEIPFSKRPNSKRLWFSKRELIAWLSEGQTKTVEVINQEANLFLKKNKS